MHVFRTIIIAAVLAVAATLLAACPQSGQGTGEPKVAATPAAGGSSGTSTTADQTPEPAAVSPAFKGADFTFKTFDGAERRLSDYVGKPVVVNFFGVT